MKQRVLRLAWWVYLGAIAAAAVSSCTFTLPKDLYKLHATETCPVLDVEDLAQRVREFDHGTETYDLKCALSQLRAASPADIHRTAASAKICYLLADRHRDATDRERLAAEGVRWAEIALEGDASLEGISDEATPEEGRVRYYLAINLGLAVRDHTAMAVKHLGKLAQELKRAIELCPDEDIGGPYRVLGMLYLVAPPWPNGMGDGDKAFELLRVAHEKYPQHPLNQIFYAQALWELKEGKAEEEVKRLLQKADALLEEGSWGGAKERWRKLAADIAEEAGIKRLPTTGE